ncbi:ArnT family glycosyltransferase [Vibrio owensii]|uniref:ArnT family glycosyltransferase n=1 Tax=Vibrio owensii TaxID=696485 RepID=UPI0038CD1D2E
METTEQIDKYNQSRAKVLPRSALILGALLFTAVVARFYVAFRYEVNWDEFYYLSFVHQLINGEAINSFQTFHIHFFTWLQHVSSNEVDQIIAARLVMIVFQLGTGLCIYKLCRLQCSVSGALFAVLAYFAFSFNVRMGASFRTDPIATFLVMISLFYVFRDQLTWRASVVCGVLTAVALLITLKTSLYIPTFLMTVLVCFYWTQDRVGYAKQILIYGCSILVSFAILYSWHYFTISSLSSGADAGSMLSAADKTMNQREFFPRWFYFQHSLVTDFGYWIALLLGIAFAVFSCFNQVQINRTASLKLLSLVLLLGTLLLYRNAFPYYYAFMLAPVCVLFAVAWDGTQHYLSDKASRFFSIIIPSLFAVSIVVNGFIFPTKSTLDYQRNFIKEIHKIFPQPVAYIDRCSMISSYSKQGFFMSTWGYEDYQARGTPVIQSAIENANPVFVVANTHYLDVLGVNALNVNQSKEDEHSGSESKDWLLEQDSEALKSNYIHHWQDLFVAGKVLHFTQEDDLQVIQIHIEGEYTLEGELNILLDGQIWKSDQVRYLSKGSYQVSSPSAGEIVMRWGDHLYRPENVSQSKALFTGF